MKNGATDRQKKIVKFFSHLLAVS